MQKSIAPPDESTVASVDSTESLSVWLRIALSLIILAGVSARIVYPTVTVFCEDQSQACALAEDIVNGHWQTGGLVNSGGFRNLPGFVYLLAGVWWVWPDPLTLNLFISLVSIAGVLLSAHLMRRWIGASAAWWGTAFFAASPWAIHYSRWIWAQDLLFPVSVVVYLLLWNWIGLGRKWASLGVILALALLVQVHLVGIVLVLAIGLFVVWSRPRLPVGPLALGAIVAIGSALPYLLDGHLGGPSGNRIGYQHFWRVVPGAAMSVSGLGWGLEFREGFDAFATSLGWRWWFYEIVMGVPALLLAVSLVAGFGVLFRLRKTGRSVRREPLPMIIALVLLIPISFDVLGLRTSPTYFPVWYPLPFALMGWLVVRLSANRRRRFRRATFNSLLLAVLIAELSFFSEQLRYIHVNGGVPESRLGRSFGGVLADVENVFRRVDASEVWMVYEGDSVIQDEPAAYLLRRGQWAGNAPGRALLHFSWGIGAAGEASRVEVLPADVDPPPDAYLVRPWIGPQQRGAEIPLRP